ncbi:methyltransferase domain-containing protein [Wenzhouxiangella sp. EGI_FJ10409]|uniref:methyltransferase domain-containing protein n=1 Tax=Wenzhouxiangella sp. EGI_FJ10409 TaxID=3243767 RepID=UPI0035D84A0F
MKSEPNTRRIRQRFDAAAQSYDRHAVLFDEVGRRLLERLDGLRFEPERIVDLGCGTARHTLALRERYPESKLLGLDSAPAMLARARKRRGRWRPRFDLACADAGAPPLAEASVDLAFANLALQWSGNLATTLSGLRRIMRPRGLLLMTLPGPDTLVELQRAGATVDMGTRAHAQELGDLLTRAGFQEPVLDTDWLTTTHADLASLLADLEHLGLDYSLPGGAQAIERELPNTHEGSIAVTWEVLYATAWSPDEGQPIRTDQGEEASISAASLGIRKRRS